MKSQAFKAAFMGGLLSLALVLGNTTLEAAVAPAGTTEASAPKPSWLKRNFGVNYNSFFYGPGIVSPQLTPPGYSGQPDDTGWYFWNLISAKWKFSERFALDVQFRNQVVVSNEFAYRHQGQRLGISGTFLKGDDWSFAGAFNSDIPVAGIAGQINEQRTLLMNPGLFSFFSYAPKSSKWSLFALAAPRIWFYRDRNALALQDAKRGGTTVKPEYTIFLNPSINYAVNDKVGVRFGTTFEFTKFVGFDDPRRSYMPFELGVTYDISPAFSVYTYLTSTTPIDDGLRADQGFPNAKWWETASINLWLSGTLF